MRNLTEKQKRFCEEYVKDSNGSQAAIRAGYSVKSSRIKASKLLTKANIRAEVERLFEQIRERNRITVDELVATLAAQVRFDISKLYDENGNMVSIHDIDEDTRKSIEEIQVDELHEGFGEERTSVGHTRKIKTSSRQNAIKLLMQHLGAFEKDNKQKTSQVVVFQLPDNNR